MKEIIFRQDRGLASQLFCLRDGALTITDKGAKSGDETTIMISDISPRVTMMKHRFPHLIVVPGMLAASLLAAAWVIYDRNALSLSIAAIPGLCATFFIGLAARGFQPIEVARFYGRKGEILFELYRPRNAKGSYETEGYAQLVSKLRTLIDHN